MKSDSPARSAPAPARADLCALPVAVDTRVTADPPAATEGSSAAHYAWRPQGGGSQPRPIADRFWPKVLKAGPDDCWLWQASIGSHGYGQLSIPGRAPEPAHRLAWTLTHGPIPDGLFVCHRCDVPRCCNPAHLFLGTVTDNNRDMARKGRQWLTVAARRRREALSAAS